MRHEPPPDIGPLIAAVHAGSGLTQGELEDRIGVTQDQVSHLERGRRCASYTVACQLAEVLVLGEVTRRACWPRPLPASAAT